MEEVWNEGANKKNVSKPVRGWTAINTPLTDGLPFCTASRVGNVFFLSGCLGNIPGKMELVSGGVINEAKQTMENIKAALSELGLGLESSDSLCISVLDVAFIFTVWASFLQQTCSNAQS